MNIPLPEQLQPFAEQAEALIKKGAVKEVEFSGRTYQIAIADPQSGQEFWTFLQFDHKNRLKDYFCSCEGEGQLEVCAHLAAAYLNIFGSGPPLHARFQESLWNLLCAFFAEAYGVETDHLIKDKESISLEDGGLRVFSAAGKTPYGKKNLAHIFFERAKETEETSLKFSNLSQEEIRLWRQGRPSLDLQYELSFWKDLAKWLMLMQDAGKDYRISFSYSQVNIPNEMILDFSDVTLSFHLNRECLHRIIPSFASVKAPLTVYGRPEEWIEKIVYIEERGELVIVQKSLSPEELGLAEEESIVFGQWIYFSKKGFFPREPHPILNQAVYTGEEIADLFENYFSMIRSKLEGTSVGTRTMPLHWAISFDDNWNLLIEAYLEKKGDLTVKGASFFGGWVYTPLKGFVPVDHAMFNRVLTTVPEPSVGDFVRQHRAWLNQQKGFNTHIAGVETRLIYSMTDDDRLQFSRLAIFEEEAKQSKDFGPWVYIKGEGFFSKVSTMSGGAIKSGVVVNKGQIPLFIMMYRDELSLIEGFFSDRCPVARMGLNIELTPMETIAITPEYVLHPEYRDRNVRFFEDYTYVEGEGFCRLLPQTLLPERFRHPIELEKENLPRFFHYEFDQLQEYALKIDPKLTPPKELHLTAEKLSLSHEGYELQVSYVSGEKMIPFSVLWQAIKESKRYVFSDVGLIDLEEDRFKWIRRILKSQVDESSNTLQLSTCELLRLNAFDSMFVKEGNELFLELTDFHIKNAPDVTALKSHLRPYQELGLRWLWFLYCHRLSGLLSDDMGLGKTHQAMGLIAAASAIEKRKVHFLVVCPTSVIYHWEEKLQEFLPAMKVCTFHGSGRSFKDFHKDYDILLTSYGIWRNEVKLLSEVRFEVAIFDEIQAAKNQKSRIHTSLLKVSSKVRIGLTGTPIENRLRELKALFDLILPNYMPSEIEYKRFFVVPIERENDNARKELLQRTVKPFVLRRKKGDVLLDLPEKTEEISHCELLSDQKILYTDILHKVRQGISRELENRTAPIPYIHIFSALSSLKQICNHPAAFLKRPMEYKSYQSGKWDLFLELLGEALESGQKVVVFSQYLAMLDIIEAYLSENSVGFASIRGETVRRGEEIRRFNRDPKCEVFVGSLQAAGLGIDLTAGSVVIHYDRWWNAAREDQATDRVHRIGQMRGVQVFKLVTKNTFEEKIDEMITRKGKLMEDVVGVDDYRFMKTFDRDEILQLFRD